MYMKMSNKWILLAIHSSDEKCMANMSNNWILLAIHSSNEKCMAKNIEYKTWQY